MGGADGEVVQEGDVAVEVFLLRFTCIFLLLFAQKKILFSQDGLVADKDDVVEEEQLQAQVDIVLCFSNDQSSFICTGSCWRQS